MDGKKMEKMFRDVMARCGKVEFLESVMRKAHYGEEERELLWSVLERILECVELEGCWKDGVVPGMEEFREVVMTLGAGVDLLQETFLSEGKLTEGYMVEVLGSEILLLAYGAYNARVKARGSYVVRRYYFLGTEEADGESGLRLGLRSLPGMLERSGLPVSCTEGYCMVPKKSVAFYAELSKDAAVTCEGICMGCGRKDCGNRMEAGEQAQGNQTLDRPLTYGYSRIFGLFS